MKIQLTNIHLLPTLRHQHVPCVILHRWLSETMRSARQQLRDRQKHNSTPSPPMCTCPAGLPHWGKTALRVIHLHLSEDAGAGTLIFFIHIFFLAEGGAELKQSHSNKETSGKSSKKNKNSPAFLCVFPGIHKYPLKRPLRSELLCCCSYPMVLTHSSPHPLPTYPSLSTSLPPSLSLCHTHTRTRTRIGGTARMNRPICSFLILWFWYINAGVDVLNAKINLMRIAFRMLRVWQIKGHYNV